MPLCSFPGWNKSVLLVLLKIFHNLIYLNTASAEWTDILKNIQHLHTLILPFVQFCIFILMTCS